jgi:hypothetical protein
MDLLLDRAEAYIMQDKLEEASHDLQAYWNNSIETFSDKDKESYTPNTSRSSPTTSLRLTSVTLRLLRSLTALTTGTSCQRTSLQASRLVLLQFLT